VAEGDLAGRLDNIKYGVVANGVVCPGLQFGERIFARRHRRGG